jgi:hypothetical protein
VHGCSVVLGKQVWAEDWEVTGEEETRALAGNGPQLRPYPSSSESVLPLECPIAEPRSRREQQSGRERQCRGERMTCKRLPELRTRASLSGGQCEASIGRDISPGVID